MTAGRNPGIVLLVTMAVLASSCGFSAGESAQNLMSSALGTGPTNETVETTPEERTSAATVWNIVQQASSTGERPTDRPDSITAANGLTVQVLPPELGGGETEDAGDSTDARGDTPVHSQINVARLLVGDSLGNVAWTTPAGGVVASQLDLIDFDGRYVLLERFRPPDDLTSDDSTANATANGAATQHIVYDLDCRAVDAADCSHDFWTAPGTVELTADDLPPGADELNIQLLTLCPTAGQRFITPSELTANQAYGYQWAAAILASCDPSGIGGDSDELTYRPALDQSGWRWDEFAEALRGPYQSSSPETLVWGPTASGATVQINTTDSQPAVAFVAGQEPSGAISVTLGQSHIVLTGSATQEVAATVAATVTDLAVKRNREMVDRIDFTGPTVPSAAVDDLLREVDRELDRAIAAVGHVHLSPDGRIRSWTSPGVGVTNDEMAAIDALTAFAVGDANAFTDIPLADDVMLAAGDQVIARRAPTVMQTRAGWRLDLEALGDAPGPFNVLNQARGTKDVTMGALYSCDEGPPDVAPSELAEYRRLSLQPDRRLLQSCRQWSNIDLYFDDDGLIVGVGLNLFSR